MPLAVARSKRVERVEVALTRTGRPRRVRTEGAGAASSYESSSRHRVTLGWGAAPPRSSEASVATTGVGLVGSGSSYT